MYRYGPGSPRDQFLDQFEMDGGDWLYRYKMTGAAYRVTDREKHRLLAAFDRAKRRWALWAALPFVIYLVAVWMVLTVSGVEEWLSQNLPAGYTRDNGMVLLTMTFGLQGIGHWRAMRVPLRALAKRTPVAPALPKEARQRMMIDRQPLALIVGAGTISFLLLLYFAVEQPSIGWRSLVLMVASIAALAWSIVQGYRKWQLDRSDHAASNLT